MNFVKIFKKVFFQRIPSVAASEYVIELKFNSYVIFKVNESQNIALFVVSESIKKLSQLIVSIFILSQYFFSIDFARWKSVGLHYIAHIVIH